MTRVLLTGATGMFGTAVRRAAPPDVEVCSLFHRRVDRHPRSTSADLRSFEQTMQALGRVRPELVVHAAYAKDRSSITQATRNLIDAAKSVGVGRIIHCSTEGVFGGADAPRTEAEAPDPIDDYGTWKAEAERILIGADVDHTILRLPLIVSLSPASNDVVAVRANHEGGRRAGWFVDEWRPPAMADDLAAALWAVASLTRPPPILHLPGAEVMTRWELARRIARRLGLDPDEAGEPITRPDGRTAPQHLDLDDALARATIGWDPAPI